MKTFKLSLILLAFMAFAQTTWAQSTALPCLPAHGETDDISAWCGVTQTIALSAGWNWVSSYLEITMADLRAAILAAVPSTDRPIIKSQRNGQTRWSGVIWSGGLKALDLSQMYEIQVGSDCEITLQGEPINPAEHPATIKPDNNWIAFPLSDTMSVVNAFAANGAWAPTNGDIVKSRKDGQAKRTGAAWPGGLKNLVPGQGYIYNSKATTEKTLVFPTPNTTAKSASNTTRAYPANNLMKTKVLSLPTNRNKAAQSKVSFPSMTAKVKDASFEKK